MNTFAQLSDWQRSARVFNVNHHLMGESNPIKENNMTPQQIELIQNSFARVLEHPELTASLFYQCLFKLEPSLRELFPDNMTKQQRKLIEMLDVVLGDLTRLEVILPAVQRLGERHIKYGVIEAHYDTVGTALLWALEQTQGDAFSLEVRDAWVSAYT